MRTIKKSNFHVIITPRSLGNLGVIHVPDSMVTDGIEKDYLDRCQDIANNAERLEYVSRAEVCYNEDPVCEHCGRCWSEENTEYNGGCCETDEENNPESKEKE